MEKIAKLDANVIFPALNYCIAQAADDSGRDHGE